MRRRRPSPARHPLRGQTAVITGAASGMGRAVAERLSAQGCPVALVDHDEDGLEQTAASLSGPVLHRRLDVRDRQGQLAWAAAVREWAPAPIGLVLNNAGVTVVQGALEAAPEDDDWVIDINFGGVVHGVRAFLPILVEQGAGAIVNVSSVFGLVGFPHQTAYCASKFAVRGFTEALRQELRGTGVRAATVHPGGVKTNIVANARYHADVHDQRDQATAVRDFAALARTTPERAAEIICDGVEAGKARILVGPDAVLLDLLVRVAPTRYYDVIERLEAVVRRG
jgi:NADP-dependent 3-hydroxy acid dehydrogenase YdfG